MKKIIIIVLVVLICLIGIAFFYLNNVYIPKHLKPMVIKLLEENLGKNVRVGKAVYFPIRGVLFSKLEILNDDNTLLLSIETIDFGLKSIPVIKKKAFSAKLKLRIKGFVFKQDELESRGGCKVALDINIKSKDNTAFSAVMDLKDISVKGIKATGDITKIQGRIIASERDFLSEKMSANIGSQTVNIFIKGDYDKKDINIRKFNFDYIDTQLAIKGVISDPKKPSIDFTLEGLIKLEDIPGLLSGIPLPALSGEGKVTAECSGTVSGINKLKADAKIQLSKASIEKIEITGLRADAKLRSGKVIVDLDGDFYSGKINGKASAVNITKDITIDAGITADGVEIEDLVEDAAGFNIGQGTANVQAEVHGPAIDLNLLKGQGAFSVMDGKIKMPPNFAKVAKSLGAANLADMNIDQASATFVLNDGKLQTEDLILSAVEATISGKGYIDLEQYVDFEALVKLSREFVQNSGGMAQLLSFASDETGAPLAKVKVYDRLSQLKYKIVPLPVKDILKSRFKGELKNILGQEKEGEAGSGAGSDLQDQIKKGLEKLFR